MKDGKFITMGIESSCDETAIAIVADGRTVLSNIISSQIAVHKVFGGVVPEIASRHHLTNINSVYQQALDELLLQRHNTALWVLSFNGSVGEYVGRWWRDAREHRPLFKNIASYGLFAKKICWRMWRKTGK